MARVAPLLFAALLALSATSSAAVTPVEKVIKLLEDLKDQVTTEGQAEASTYDKFACFCKDTTKLKSDSITKGRDSIETLSAEIAELTANKEADIAELTKRQADQEGYKADLSETTIRCAKAAADYEAAAADLSKAISSLQAAIKSMETAKSASLIALSADVRSSLDLADAMGLISEPKKREVTAFLQTGASVDPTDPEYKYHSQGIVDTLNKLLGEFTTAKSDLDDEWTKTKKTCDDTKKALNDKITENDLAMTQLSVEIENLKMKIASDRETLVTDEGVLTDDQQYLTDLTLRCETSAREWDQRSQMRADELEALTGALSILTTTVAQMDKEAGNRTFLLQRDPDHAKNPDERSPDHAKNPDERSPDHAKNPDERTTNISGNNHSKADLPTEARLAAVAKHSAAAALAFLQTRSHTGLRGAHAAALTTQAQQDQIVSLLSREGRRLGSSALSALAMRVAADPFLKVKELIQNLIERLLSESTAEAEKKGFCDTELGKANSDRDFRLEEAKALNADLKLLEIKRDELMAEIDELIAAIHTLEVNLAEATELREAQHKENVEVIEKAKEGASAVRSAISILKLFYTRGGRAHVLLEEAESPVDVDTKGAGFSGAYQARQESSKGIIGLLDVIKSDFDRTAKMTEAQEAKQHADFVEFDRVSRADISAKTTKQTLDTEDLTTTNNTIASKMADLQTAQDLLDHALRTLEDLKPTCTDTGMSYAERVAKREEEITALKKALCILDTEGVEADCGK